MSPATAPVAPATAPERLGDVRLLFALVATLLVVSVAERARYDSDAPPELPIAPFRIDVNHAEPDELSALPGVGPLLALRIDRERRSGGPFRCADDLQRVPGIGPTVVARLAPHVRFDPDDH
ncbi:MAG: helix-hairpin-helix domain-containing protein [Planctomycetes bacterium]|nr:helix-hairpin-helix domain-containing protein [Planctomycetota bacterium]